MKKKTGKKTKNKPELMVGGQAVIEGVLMRTGDKYAVAVRHPKGHIVVKKKKHISLTKRNKFLGLPFIRGIIVLIETIGLGYKALTFSANQGLEDRESKQGKKQELGTIELIITFGISLLFALALFKFLPLGIATLFKNSFGGNNLLFNLVDGLSKFVIFILYILAISLMKDVKRLFQYHGAEHKTVYCYEANKELTVKNVRKYSKAHPRCGTTFILIVLLLSILFYLFIPFGMNFWANLGIRVLFIFPVTGIAYEWIRITGKHQHKRYAKILAAPGLLVQKLTTREPDDKQIEVAIRALNATVS